jgi:hypothetical protein
MSAGAAEDREPLVRYRLHGGGAHVDQRITVFDDGLVELDERHRRRGRTRLTIGEGELEQLRAALGRIPDARWSLGPTLALSRARFALGELFTLWHQQRQARTFFQLRSGRRSIAAETESASLDIEDARALLDSLRVHAVRLAEEQSPT